MSFDLPDLQRTQRTPPPPATPPMYTPSRGTNQRIEERRLREELVTQQRAEKKCVNLGRLNKFTSTSASDRAAGHHKGSSAALGSQEKLNSYALYTRENHASREGFASKLDLRISSTAADVKRAYKQALRAVHPDKLATASVDDRVRGEFVFSALREAYSRAEKLKEDKERGVAANAPRRRVE